MIEHALAQFQHYFPGNKDTIRVFFAPGRVNLIGEHTDYNGGWVLPAALTIGTILVVRPRRDGEFHLVSENFPGRPVHFDVDHLDFDRNDPWGNYPKGIMKELIAEGLKLEGADLYYNGNIPNGAGLSSSASIGMVTALALSELAGHKLPVEELAFICQRMENGFIGVNTGIMDQFAVGFGRKDHAIFLNCRTLKKEEVPLDLGDYKIVITNTNKRRGLADSKYNERRSECETGLTALQRIEPGLNTLSDLSVADFERLESRIEDETVRRRVRHVVKENDRVVRATRLLQNKDLRGFGELMEQSHVSLRDDYEVTGRELDVLFDAQRQAEGCIGTRMTGAGFGGCTVSLVAADEIESFKTRVAAIYERETGLEPSFYSCKAGDGVKELKTTVV
ncbi:MAG TPA: galactokinase [Bacillales bacterium]|nr:galactokinase [Bacillales bacterium]